MADTSAQLQQLLLSIEEGRLTRQEVLRRAAALGLGASAVGALLADIGSADAVRAATLDGSTSAKGTKITYAVQSFAHQALQPFLREFKTKTGITVKLVSGPATGQDLMTQLIPAFSSGSTPFDVLDADDPSAEAFASAGWLEPLDDALEPHFWSDFPLSMIGATQTWNQIGGKTYRIYHNWELGYFWNRKDVLDALHLKVPTTWDELVMVGKAAMQKKHMWGFADAVSKPGLTFVYLAYIVAQAGGKLYEFDEGTRRGFQFAHDLIYKHQIFPKTALTWTYDQLNAAYTGNRLLTMREWTFFWDVSKAQKQWYNLSKVHITLPPAGPGGAKTWAGGWGWTIPKFTKNKGAAKEFIRFITSRTNAPRLARASSFFVTSRHSVMDVLGNQGITRYMKLYTEKGAVTPRPHTKQAAKAETIIDDIGQAYLTNQIDLNTAMQQGKQRVSALR